MDEAMPHVRHYAVDIDDRDRPPGVVGRLGLGPRGHRQNGTVTNKWKRIAA
jgi:hypothetical protein